MTLPVTNGLADSTADIYTDFAGLASLKKSAHNNDPEALRQVAKQYESLFTRIMLKSMREAVGKDPVFGSDESQTYEGMYDDQLSIELSKGKGLGLADLLVRQMQRLTGGTAVARGTSGTDAATTTQTASGSNSGTAPGGRSLRAPGSASGVRSALPAESAVGALGLPLPARAKAALQYLQQAGSSAGSAVPSPASAQAQDNFISDLWPAARQAGQQLGVDPRNLIAQAALETNWGTRVPRDATGRSSNNLFGMKAGSQWSGTSVTAATQEYDNGAPISTTGQFRAYDTREQSFQDYVSLLRNSPRYTAALNTGSDTHAFANALQRGGYATDPAYASKIAAIAASIQQPAATSEPSLKSASARPINPNADTL
jgi:flagellar protein FlgJ